MELLWCCCISLITRGLLPLLLRMRKTKKTMLWLYYYIPYKKKSSVSKSLHQFVCSVAIDTMVPRATGSYSLLYHGHQLATSYCNSWLERSS
jgi:hypothetical protein